ncbi:unnamed protein product [Lampetra planeri]
MPANHNPTFPPPPPITGQDTAWTQTRDVTMSETGGTALAAETASRRTSTHHPHPAEMERWKWSKITEGGGITDAAERLSSSSGGTMADNDGR